MIAASKPFRNPRSVSNDRALLAGLGREIGPAMMQGVKQLYEREQASLAAAIPPAAQDVPYGSDPRQVLDLYRPVTAWTDGRTPVLVFVHGGGFRRGAKSDPSHPYEAHMGRFAAQNGMLGAVMNYRLAPQHVYPAGGEDVGLTVDWLRDHAAEHGGDPARIVLIATSAGAAHVATLLKLRPTIPVAGVVMLSGLYGIEPYVDPERDLLYYGTDRTRYPETVTADALAASDIPLLITCAEFDPHRFQAEFVGLLARFVAAGKPLPPALVAADHNHFSLGMHLGSSDTRVADVIMRFVDERCKPVAEEQPA